MSISRRQVLATSLALPVSGLVLAGPAAAQSAIAAELMVAGALPDLWLGKDDAPVTVVEYASMTCPHCQNFHASVLPYLKTNYIDTGKVRLVFREFPLDQMAAAVSMLARCAPKDKFFDVVGLFYETQPTWSHSNKPLDAIRAVAKQAGFTEESFKTCLSDQKLLDNVVAMRTRASEKFKVDATPTFFINGKKADAFHTPDQVDQALKALI